jgi:hypothetical protein
MRKVLIFTNVIFLAVAVLYSCSLLKSLEEVNKNGFICNNYSAAPVNEMDKQEVVEMVRNYYNNQYAALHDVTSATKLTGLPVNCPQDSRAVFFNLDTLKKLIYYIEKGSKNFSVADKQNLGLNVYFASYPESFLKVKNGYSYTNRHTLIFIPSIFKTGDSLARDIDLNANLSGVNSRPEYLTDLFFNINTKSKKMVGIAEGSGSMMSQNNGSGTPPPKKPTGNPLLDKTDH